MNIDVRSLVAALRGQSGKLRTSKPAGHPKDNGLYQYCWRMCRFDAGYDRHMPVMCIHDLQLWLNAQGVVATVDGFNDARGKEILALLDKVTDVVLEALGESKYSGALAWRGLI